MISLRVHHTSRYHARNIKARNRFVDVAVFGVLTKFRRSRSPGLQLLAGDKIPVGNDFAVGGNNRSSINVYSFNWMAQFCGGDFLTGSPGVSQPILKVSQ